MPEGALNSLRVLPMSYVRPPAHQHAANEKKSQLPGNKQASSPCYAVYNIESY